MHWFRSGLEGAAPGGLGDEVLEDALVETREGVSLRHSRHVVQAEPEAEVLQLVSVVLKKDHRAVQD